MKLKSLLVAANVGVLVCTAVMVAQTKQMSHGDLYKQALAQEKAPNIDAAYESIKEARVKKGKSTDKKYEEMFARLGAQLADREAEKGEAACKASDFVLCDQQLQKAKAFSSTSKVQGLEATLQRQLTELKANYASVIQLGKTNPDRALVEIENFRKFIVTLTDVPTQAELIRTQAIALHLSAGTSALMSRKWDEATDHFNTVLVLAPADTRATAGLKDTARLKEAYKFQDDATAALDLKNYRTALQSMDRAIGTAPEVNEFKEKRQLIARQWTTALVDGLEEMVADQTSREKTRDAYLRIEDLKSLDSSHPSVKALSDQIRQNFGGTLLDRVTELEKIQDYSQHGTAAISKAKAAELLPQGTLKTEDLKGVFGFFNKRRSSQLLIASADLSGADPVFVQTATLRAKSASENASLPDIRVRNLADFEKQPDSEPIVDGMRVAGKSSTVLLTVSVNRYSNFKKAGEPQNRTSKFNGPKENVLNPRYQELRTQYEALAKDLKDEKKKKEWPSIQNQQDYIDTQLKGVKEYNEVTKQVDYTYREIPWQQDVAIEVTLTLKDYITQNDIYKPPPIVVTDHIVDVEISGIHKDDSQGLQNRTPTKISDDAFTQVRNKVLEGITALTAEMLPHYTRRFFEEGDAKKAIDTDGAVEDFISHWAFFRGKIEKKELDYISEFVQKQIGFNLATEGPRLIQVGLVTTAVIDRR